MSFELRGKHLLFLASKPFVSSEEELETCIWKNLKTTHGISSITMVLLPIDSNEYWCKRLVETGYIDDYECTGFLQLLRDRKSDDGCFDVTEVSEQIVNWLQSKGRKINGCVCPTDRLLQLKAAICERLELPSDGVDAMEAAVHKDLTQARVLNNPVARKHGVQSFAVETLEELEDACHNLSFPVIIKPSSGMGSHGVRSVNTLEDAKAYLIRLQQDIVNGGSLTAKLDASEKVVVMERLFGTQYAVDVVISDGDLIGGVIVQRGKPSAPSFYATALAMPGDMSKEDQDELVLASYHCCLAVGLRNGVYDVDMMWEEKKLPKLIEINPRFGGYSISNCAKVIYNVDLLLLDVFLSCGVKISKATVPLEPRGHVVGHLAFTHRDEKALRKIVSRLKECRSDKNFLVKDLVSQGVVEALKSTRFIRAPVCCFLYHGKTHDHSMNMLADNLTKIGFLSSEKDLFKLFESQARDLTAV